jgi:hypothetical protein
LFAAAPTEAAIRRRSRRGDAVGSRLWRAQRAGPEDIAQRPVLLGLEEGETTAADLSSELPASIFVDAEVVVN